jgi:hypothetical protein
MSLFELDPNETGRAIDAAKGVLRMLQEAPPEGKLEEYKEALEALKDATIATRRYQESIHSRHKPRNSDEEDNLSNLWFGAAQKIDEFNPEVGALCRVKGWGWADETTWDLPENRDLPISLEQMTSKYQSVMKSVNSYANARKEFEGLAQQIAAAKTTDIAGAVPSRSGASRSNLQDQPLGPIGYAVIAGGCILISLLIGWYIVFESDLLIKNGIFGPAYYVLLAVLGLSVAGFLFGVMRSYATFSGQRFGGVLELGGPAVAAFLTIVGGLWVMPTQSQFDMTVRFQGDDGLKGVPTSGFVIVDIEGRRDREPIDAYGQAIIKSVPFRLQNKKFSIFSLEAPGFKLKDNKLTYPVEPGGVISIPVVREAAGLRPKVIWESADNFRAFLSVVNVTDAPIELTSITITQTADVDFCQNCAAERVPLNISISSSTGVPTTGDLDLYKGLVVFGYDQTSTIAPHASESYVLNVHGNGANGAVLYVSMTYIKLDTGDTVVYDQDVLLIVTKKEITILSLDKLDAVPKKFLTPVLRSLTRIASARPIYNVTEIAISNDDVEISYLARSILYDFLARSLVEQRVNPGSESAHAVEEQFGRVNDLLKSTEGSSSSDLQRKGRALCIQKMFPFIRNQTESKLQEFEKVGMNELPSLTSLGVLAHMPVGSMMSYSENKVPVCETLGVVYRDGVMTVTRKNSNE